MVLGKSKFGKRSNGGIMEIAMPVFSMVSKMFGGDAPDAPPPPAPPPPAPTTDNAESQAAKDAAQKRAANAKGLASTDVTKGTLGGDNSTASTNKPTLLGG